MRRLTAFRIEDRKQQLLEQALQLQKSNEDSKASEKADRDESVRLSRIDDEDDEDDDDEDDTKNDSILN